MQNFTIIIIQHKSTTGKEQEWGSYKKREWFSGRGNVAMYKV